MIASLTPEEGNSVATTAEPTSQDTDEPVSQLSSGFDIEPRADWKPRDWNIALMHCVAIDDTAAEDRLTEAYFRSHLGATDLDKDEWRAKREYYRIYFGKKGGLSTLLDLAKKQPNSVSIATDVAKTYQSYDEYAKAAEVFKDTVEKASSDLERVELLGQTAWALHKAGLAAEATHVFNRMRDLNGKDSGLEAKILRWEKSLADAKDDHHRSLGAMERQLELDPSDVDTRFSLAYKYSDVDSQDALALLHYTRIPPNERTAMAWNNLGWAYESLDLPIKSVHAYREAEQRGETLAMSNLSRKLLAGGFCNEAKKTLDVAVKIEDYNKAVDRTLTSVKDATDEEDKKEKGLLDQARPISEFYRGFGGATAKHLSGPLARAWRGPSCELQVKIEGDAFHAVGEYEVKLGLMASALAERTGLGDDARTTTSTYVVEYDGRIQGRTITGTLSRRRDDGSRKHSLLIDDPRTAVLMWVSDDSKVIHVLERTSPSGPRLHALESM